MVNSSSGSVHGHGCQRVLRSFLPDPIREGQQLERGRVPNTVGLIALRSRRQRTAEQLFGSIN